MWWSLRRTAGEKKEEKNSEICKNASSSSTSKFQIFGSRAYRNTQTFLQSRPRWRLIRCPACDFRLLNVSENTYFVISYFLSQRVKQYQHKVRWPLRILKFRKYPKARSGSSTETLKCVSANASTQSTKSVSLCLLSTLLRIISSGLLFVALLCLLYSSYFSLHGRHTCPSGTKCSRAKANLTIPKQDGGVPGTFVVGRTYILKFAYSVKRWPFNCLDIFQTRSIFSDQRSNEHEPDRKSWGRPPVSVNGILTNAIKRMKCF